MHAYDPRDDEEPDYEPDDNYYKPDPDYDDVDWEDYGRWLDSQPKQVGPGRVTSDADLPPYDDPFAE